jgi:protein-S-isoprenylcysteine O-methyltransferase Ste14
LNLEYVAIIVVTIFPLTEVYLSVKRRARTGEGFIDDQGSLETIWKTILVGLALAAICGSVTSLPLFKSPTERFILTTFFVLAGMVFRQIAIYMLGRQFTVNVAILDNHMLVDTGLYRWIRHPSYTGLLISFFGCGLATNNFLSVIALLTPITWALTRRIRLEESMLADTFGQNYLAYCNKTWKLVPFIW